METSRLILPIDNEAIAIERAIQAIVIPYPSGIYIRGNEIASVDSKGFFYRLERHKPKLFKEVEVKTIDDIHGNVFNEDGEIVISDSVSLYKEKMLFSSPTVPVIGRDIVRAYVRDVLDFTQIHKNVKRTYGNLKKAYQHSVNKVYNNEKNYESFESIVTDTCFQLYADIKGFSGKRTWDILIPSFNKDTITIENNGDYRIQDWMKRYGSKYNI